MVNKIKRLRRFILGKIRLTIFRLSGSNISAEKGFFCDSNCFVSSKNKIRIGRDFYMGHNCHLSANADIGNDVLFASCVSLVGGDHIIDKIEGPIRLSGREILKTITIEDNVWIGHGVIIMHGIKIETGSVVAAGSVVTKDVPKNAIVGGNPAKFIRFRIL